MSFDKAPKRALVTVHENVIWTDEVRKEQRWNTIHRNFNHDLNDLGRMTDRPKQGPPYDDDPDLTEVIDKAHKKDPTQDYTHTECESQEIGWISTTPLIDSVMDRTDWRLNYPRYYSDITTLMETAGAWPQLKKINLREKGVLRWK